MNDRHQRAQALVLIAMGFVGLAAFIGLTVDAGILFTQIGHLRRAVDAAALAAANQFREGRTTGQMVKTAEEFISLNNLNPSTVKVKICDILNPTPDPDIHDPSLCPAPGEDDRKYVRVEAEMPVHFAFLPVIGFGELVISADAVSEAASLDLVLVVDTSASMAFDLCTDGKDNDGDGVADDCNGFPGKPSQVGSEPDSDPELCNPNRFDPDPAARVNDCHPFEELRAASQALLDRMFFPYDRMAVVTFDWSASVKISLADGNNHAAVKAALDSMEVSTDSLPPSCTFPSDGDPRTCPSTNTSAGLLAAGSQFALNTRPEAVWVVVLISDGGANAAFSGGDAFDKSKWICPGTAGNPTWIAPLCKDPWADTRHDRDNPEYDADDAAYDAALYVGCLDTPNPSVGCPDRGNGAVIFTIGLGESMVNNQECAQYYGDNFPSRNPSCDPDLGERLLRDIAAIGDDANPSTNPCSGVPTSSKSAPKSCGNYYFSPTGVALRDVFEAIASRIFTRITH